MILTASEDFLPWDLLRDKLAMLTKAVEVEDFALVRQLLRELVSGYTPEGEIVDWVYQQRLRDV
ncbi:hypothetical protein D3C79_996090 [compost metagenome]